MAAKPIRPKRNGIEPEPFAPFALNICGSIAASVRVACRLLFFNRHTDKEGMMQRMTSGKNTIRKRDVAAAFHTAVPIMVTYIVLGAGFGLLMQKHGFGPGWSLLSGIVIFSGTVQFVSVTMLSSGSVLMAAVTAFMVAARHIFFSISMIGRYKNEGPKKWYLYYSLSDETYAMLSKDDGPEDVDTGAYRLLVSLFDQGSWLAGCVLGGWIGTLVAFDSTGIDFSMTALFTTV